MKVGIIACGAIVRELTAVAQRLGWEYELTAVPAQLHNRPERIAPAVAARLDGWADRFDWILVGYGDCGSGGALDALLERYPHALRIPGPHCYDFYGGATFQQQAENEPGTFYLTDFLASHFEGLVIEELGLDRFPQLRDSYFGNYRELLYLQQLPDQNQSERAEKAAARLGLTYREADTGLDELALRLQSTVALHQSNKKDVEMAEKICPVCESSLTGEAIREGRCQCCGSALPQPEPTESETAESSR